MSGAGQPRRQEPGEEELQSRKEHGGTTMGWVTPVSKYLRGSGILVVGLA